MNEQPTIDSLLLADFAEVVNGKLYLMGGGFTTVALATFDQPHRCYVAAALRIPWSHTNQKIAFSAGLENLDGATIDSWSMEGQLEAGRAPGQRPGDTVTMIASPVDVIVPEPMDVVLRLTFGDDQRTVPFKLTQVV